MNQFKSDGVAMDGRTREVQNTASRDNQAIDRLISGRLREQTLKARVRSQ